MLKPPLPEALPAPHGARPRLALAELTPGRYVDTVARVVSVRVSRRFDEMGERPVVLGLLEDNTFRVPLLSYRTSPPLTVNSVFEFRSVYVHEEEGRGVMVILTEHSRAEPRGVDDLRRFLWLPKIGEIKRPVFDVTLRGIVSTIYSPSGLVKRCNRCGRLVVDACPSGCGEGWSWDLRISSRLYDGTGSIRMVLARQLAARLLQRSLGEILYLTGAGRPATLGSHPIQSYSIRLPDGLEVVEAVVGDAWSLPVKDKLAVPDGATLLYYPPDQEPPMKPAEASLKMLQPKLDPRDAKILRRLVEKALDIKIREVTGRPRLHGIYLLEEPIPLYSCERAKLYLGFSIRTVLDREHIRVEAAPQALVRESVWDYVKWRRSRGASARSIKHSLLTQRATVVLAPSGRHGRIEEVLFRRVGQQPAPGQGSKGLMEFWREMYDVEVSPDELPLLRVRPADSDVLLTYPPSTVFFDESLLLPPEGVRRFIAHRRASIGHRVRAVMLRALVGLRVGGWSLQVEGDVGETIEIQRALLYEVHQKVLGRVVEARGPVIQLNDQLCFFPSRLVVQA